MNARFWVFHRGAWVKLTIRKDVSLAIAHFAKDDEGYSFERQRWAFDGRQVWNEWEYGGRDCDGRISSSGCHVCRLARLRVEPVEKDVFNAETDCETDGTPIYRPAWEEAEPVRCYDEAAQLANY